MIWFISYGPYNIPPYGNYPWESRLWSKDSRKSWSSITFYIVEKKRVCVFFFVIPLIVGLLVPYFLLRESIYRHRMIYQRSTGQIVITGTLVWSCWKLLNIIRGKWLNAWLVQSSQFPQSVQSSQFEKCIPSNYAFDFNWIFHCDFGWNSRIAMPEEQRGSHWKAEGFINASSAWSSMSDLTF